MNFEADLSEGIKDPEKAKAVIKKIQTEMDALVVANQEALSVAKNANKNASDFEKQLHEQVKVNFELVETVKSIHTVLGSKKDLWREDEQMNVLMNTLASFVVSPGAIKAGVVSHGNSQEK